MAPTRRPRSCASSAVVVLPIASAFSRSPRSPGTRPASCSQSVCSWVVTWLGGWYGKETVGEMVVDWPRDVPLPAERCPVVRSRSVRALSTGLTRGARQIEGGAEREQPSERAPSSFAALLSGVGVIPSFRHCSPPIPRNPLRRFYRNSAGRLFLMRTFAFPPAATLHRMNGHLSCADSLHQSPGAVRVCDTQNASASLLPF